MTIQSNIDKIRDLLTKIEQSHITPLNEPNASIRANGEFFGLPEIIISIIDYLQPQLLPYENAIYWYAFRHSFLISESPFVRLSTNKLKKTKTVIQSSSGQSARLSQETVRVALRGLEEKGVVMKAGDTNREGTLYRVLLPDEIEICRQRMHEIATEKLPEVIPQKEVDYYNIKENRLKIFERDEYQCYYCGKQLTRFSATLDHIQPVSQGGNNAFDNLITACLHCNSKRRAEPIADMISDISNINDG